MAKQTSTLFMLAMSVALCAVVLTILRRTSSEIKDPESFENYEYKELVARPDPPAVYREDPDAQVLAPSVLPDGSVPSSQMLPSSGQMVTPSSMANDPGSSMADMGVGGDMGMADMSVADTGVGGDMGTVGADMGVGADMSMGADTGRMGVSMGTGADIGVDAAAAEGLVTIEPFAGSEFGAY